MLFLPLLQLLFHFEISKKFNQNPLITQNRKMEDQEPDDFKRIRLLDGTMLVGRL
jgi:hypothetical protein